jgi:trehalose 6-phosphate phosphatase
VDLLERLSADPARAALILDVDGALAPIVPRVEDAAVPEETRRELQRLAGRYRLLAFLTGRTSEDARRVVGVEGTYVGVHGLELEPEAEGWRPVLREFLASDWHWGQVEDKGVAVAFHWRSADDEGAAQADAGALARRAEAQGLAPRFGRKALELRPPVGADKGTAIQGLLASPEIAAALYAGDDTTDLDAFRGLMQAGLETAVRVAVLSDESPPELREQADLAVEGPEGLLGLLQEL